MAAKDSTVSRSTQDNGPASTGSERGSLLIEVRDVSKVYRLKRETVHALRDVTLDVFRGEYLSIMGPSGSGKSTLFNIIGALDRPSSGHVRIGPLDLTQLSSRQLAYVRSNYIGYVFQAYNLIPSLTALKNVALPAIFAGATVAQADRGGPRTPPLPSSGRAFGRAAATRRHRSSPGQRPDHHPGR